MMSPHMRRTIAVVTGTRAEFGLLRSVMRAVRDHPGLRLQVVATGTHLLTSPDGTRTLDEIQVEFDVNATVPMQVEGQTGRLADAAALGRGIAGFASLFAETHPDVVVVLGDRIEAFAAAAAASVGGIRVAHIHGGDRAAGIADEAMRHAITKLSHIHFAATARSTERLLYLGEMPLHVHLVGSPAVDDLASISPLTEDEYRKLDQPQIVYLLHPEDVSSDEEFTRAQRLLKQCARIGRTLALHPNHDPGREHVLRAIQETPEVKAVAHLPREKFIGLLRRAKVIVGNSSAGLIECAALGVPCVNVGVRQAGRETPRTVTSIVNWDFGDIGLAIERAVQQIRTPDDAAAALRQPYGDGHAGQKIAEVLATFDTRHYPLSKRNSY
ncbi:MAG TPA: UDP-N-acetylglucosamine 2-epimerase [Phycisphaerales bacterium]|nr:UDP-N-acetylglucosamine 2-epimerase [Phycisphaerales bacterium]